MDEDVRALWEPWMIEADHLLEDEGLIQQVFEAQGKRHEYSATKGRFLVHVNLRSISAHDQKFELLVNSLVAGSQPLNKPRLVADSAPTTYAELAGKFRTGGKPARSSSVLQIAEPTGVSSERRCPFTTGQLETISIDHTIELGAAHHLLDRSADRQEFIQAGWLSYILRRAEP